VQTHTRLKQFKENTNYLKQNINSLKNEEPILGNLGRHNTRHTDTARHVRIPQQNQPTLNRRGLPPPSVPSSKKSERLLEHEDYVFVVPPDSPETGIVVPNGTSERINSIKSV
jgi:hypothetical protein